MRKITVTILLLTSIITSSIAQELKLEGKFVRVYQMGPIVLDFKSNGSAEVDFKNDGTVDVTSEYSIEEDIVSFKDTEGQACPNIGKYKIYKSEYYISLDLMDDNCGGRIKPTMGFWVKPNVEEVISKLTKDIETSPKPEYHLSRARVYMALGKSDLAKKDFDIYLATETNDARAYINRAGTKFPYDMQGAVDDCNKALKIEPKNKNAYFLRGLALYELGKKEDACNDFYKAIDLGFTILKEAEKQRCEEYWEKVIEEDKVNIYSKIIFLKHLRTNQTTLSDFNNINLSILE